MIRLILYFLILPVVTIGIFAEKPNILWIVGENLKLDLGCYGAKNVKTPNLDKLAKNNIIHKNKAANLKSKLSKLI